MHFICVPFDKCSDGAEMKIVFDICYIKLIYDISIMYSLLDLFILSQLGKNNHPIFDIRYEYIHRISNVNDKGYACKPRGYRTLLPRIPEATTFLQKARTTIR